MATTKKITKSSSVKTGKVGKSSAAVKAATLATAKKAILAEHAAHKTAGRLTVNHAGGEAFSQTDKMKLVGSLLTSFAEDTYYESGEGSTKRVATILESLNTTGQLMFAGKAAIYARNTFGMRSITHVAAAEIAKKVKGQTWTRKFFKAVVRRPDDMMETLAYYLTHYGKPIPNSLKRGFADALISKFDGYQLAKYKAEKRAIKLVDIINLVHPKPGEDLKTTFDALMGGELKNTETWEAKQTAAGQANATKTEEEKIEAKAGVWKEMLTEKKLGYFALLKNLRNIWQVADAETKKLALAYLCNEKAITNSLVMPFRYWRAYQELDKETLTGKTELLKGVAKALDISLSNVPHFEGKTLVAVDVSGSMQSHYDKAAIFAAALAKANNADVYLFDDKSRVMVYDANDSVVDIIKVLHSNMTGGSTNLNSVFKLAEKNNVKYDRIIVISDMQNWDTRQYGFGGERAANVVYKEYKVKTGASPKLYSFDVASSGTMQFPQEDVVCITGYSEKVFDMMKILEANPSSFVEEIEKIVIE
jgi:hypothetical protein